MNEDFKSSENVLLYIFEIVANFLEISKKDEKSMSKVKNLSQDSIYSLYSELLKFYGTDNDKKIQSLLDTSIAIIQYIFIALIKLHTYSIDSTDLNYVYLLTSVSGTKIGISKTPKSRERCLSTLMPFEIIESKYFKVNNPYTIETSLHKQFASQKIRGEWFNLSKEDREVAMKYIQDKSKD